MFQRFSRIALLGTAVLTSVSVASLVARAMGLTPMAMEMLTIGRDNHTQFLVSNTSDKPIPVEVTYEHLSYTESGDRRTSRAADELVILPITALIPPGATQTFRIQWVGNPDIQRSQSFLVTARQLPVNFKDDGKNHMRVQVVQAFGAILNVAPPQGTSDLKLIKSEPSRLPNGKPALAVTVENPGNIHALFSNAGIRAGDLILSPDTIRTTVGIGVVEPGKRRRFLVPVERRVSGPVTLTYRQPSR